MVLCAKMKTMKILIGKRYVIYKLPSEKTTNGLQYMYITSNNYKSGWTLSNISINDSKSIPGLTLHPFYKNETSLHILYNDEKPSGEINNRLGHTKGVILSNETIGFWLIHSVPHFPSENKYDYPDSGLRFGQSFLCVSFTTETINNIGKQLQYNEPNIYKSFIASRLKNTLNNINSVIEKDFVKSEPWYRLTTLYSLQGEKFLSFAKSGKYGKEIYADWIAPTLKNNLFVETWLNGEGKIPSDCNSIYQVKNIEAVKLSDMTFRSTKDHSKWALTDLENNIENWICIGDINREEHQKLRGGGTMCISKKELWNNYKESIVKIEPCDK